MKKGIKEKNKKSTSANIEQLVRRHGEAILLLNEILKHQIANRGTKNAFYICYTYDGKFPDWVEKAERYVSQ
jgi:hypothetical protein